MANLTLAIDDDLLQRARMRAVAEGTSVNAVVREFLEDYTGEAATAAMERFLASARTSRGGSGPGGRKWKRDDLYDR